MNIGIDKVLGESRNASFTRRINCSNKKIELVQLIQSQGYQLKKNGKDYLLSCPWYDDKEASLVDSPDTNLWHCMGACQTGGSVID